MGITDQKIREVLEKFSLEPFQYYIVVSRIVPENNLDHIIRGFINSGTNKKLLVIGSFSGDQYSKSLRQMIERYKQKIIAPGGIYDKDELEILRANATAYIHGHSVGGTNPSLLEAMASRNFCICHDNPFNREVADNLGLYFKNAEELADNIQIIEKMDEKNLENIRDRLFKRIVDYYNWEKIGERWYKKILNLQN